MIRLNLLPSRPSRFRFQPRALLFLLGSALVILATALLHFQFARSQRGLQVIHAEKQIGLRLKQKELARRRQQAAAHNTVQKQIRILRDARKAQDFPVRLLTVALEEIGSARISLRFLELEPAGALQVRGVAFDARTLAAYTRRLKQHSEIQEVRVVETASHQVEPFTFLYFVCRILPAVPETENSRSGGHDQKTGA